MRHFIFAVIACCVSFLLASTAFAEMALVGPGHAACPVIVNPAADAQEQQAAAELAKYLTTITGAPFAVQKKSPPAAAAGDSATSSIFIGPAGDEARPADLGEDGFLIRCDGQKELHIVGGSSRGTLYGVFAFLEENLGCRWWSHNEEDVPTNLNPQLGVIKRRVRPPFALHDLYNIEAQNNENLFAYKSRATGALNFTGGHTLYPLLTPYATAHPEIYPMDAKGERKANALHFCYSAPGIADALTAALAKEVEAHHGDVKHWIYFAGMGDWYGGMCQCPVCKKIYEEETWTDSDGNKKPGYTGTLIRMMNQVGENLEKKYPGVQVGTFAYMSLEAPPALTKPRDNVVIWLPRLRHCGVHSVEECDVNRSTLLNMQRWAQLAPGRLYIWEYGADFGNFMWPFPCLTSMAENFAAYRRMRVNGVSVQGNYATTGGDLVVLKNYIWSKMLWDTGDPKDRNDTHLKLEGLLKEFCTGYYGPAGEDMIEYVHTVEASVRGPTLHHANEFDSPDKFLAPDVRGRLLAILSAAQAAADASPNKDYGRRVHEAAVSLEALSLWKEGPLEERDGKLVRTNVGAYTFDRAEQLIKYSRNCTPREFGTARGYQMGFLAWQGGPVTTLTAKDVSVKVAPIRGGRIMSIRFAGKEVVRDEIEHLNFGAALYRPEAQSAGNSVSMVAELGIGGWSPETKHLGRKTVELTPQGEVHIINAVKRVNQAAGQSIGGTIVTSYPVEGNLAAVKVEIQPLGGPWQAVELPKDKKPVTFAAAASLRITLPGAGAVVYDRYLPAPGLAGGELAVLTGDAGTTLQVTATLAPTPIATDDQFHAFVERTLSFQPVGAAAPATRP